MIEVKLVIDGKTILIFLAPENMRYTSIFPYAGAEYRVETKPIEFEEQ